MRPHVGVKHCAELYLLNDLQLEEVRARVQARKQYSAALEKQTAAQRQGINDKLKTAPGAAKVSREGCSAVQKP